MAVIAIFIYSAQSVREQQKAVAVAQQRQAMENEAAARKAAQDAAAEKAMAAQEAAAKQAKADRDSAMEQAKAAMEHEKAVQEAAARHAQFLAQYLNVSLPQKTGNKTVAIAVASENGTLNRAVADAIADRFKKESIQIISSLFKPAFVADGIFQEILNGSGGPFVRLDLANSLDGVVLARQDVHYAQNPSLQNVISATMQLKVAVVPVSGQSDGKTWTFTAYGPGFTKEVARQTAEERLIKQITNDTNMSLDAITSNH
jgi:predicted 2-oxoglutarate/Fe(II)-dependent dioxygenase YbiX